MLFFNGDWGLGIGDWGLGNGDWGLGSNSNLSKELYSAIFPSHFFL